MKYELTKYEDRDHMPREVAIELLTTPKNKLSARMRKNCMQALQNVTQSTHPIRLAVELGENYWETTSREYRNEYPPETKLVKIMDVDYKPRTIEQRMARLVTRFPFDRLRRLVIRCARRSARVQRALAKAERTLKVPYILNMIRADLQTRLDMLQKMGEAARNEMMMRRFPIINP